jgi:hypothetical protein
MSAYYAAGLVAVLEHLSLSEFFNEMPTKPPLSGGSNATAPPRRNIPRSSRRRGAA